MTLTSLIGKKEIKLTLRPERVYLSDKKVNLGLTYSTREMPSLQRETNLDTPFCNMLFCTNLLDPVCSLVEQKALRLYHPIRTEYNLWIHSGSSSSPWFEPLFNHCQILYLYCVTKRRGLYLGSFFCYT